MKKDSHRVFKPHRIVLINNKATKQHNLFSYYNHGLLCRSMLLARAVGCRGGAAGGGVGRGGWRVCGPGLT